MILAERLKKFEILRDFTDYRDYESISIGIWSLRWFFFLCFYNLDGSVPLYRFGAFIDINYVLSQLSRDNWHVGRLPSEDIFVVPEKVGEREFLFFGEVGTDDSHLRGITSTQINLNGICLRGWGNDSRLLSQNLHVFWLSLLCNVGNLLCFIGLLRSSYDLDDFRVIVIWALEVASKGEYAIGT